MGFKNNIQSNNILTGKNGGQVKLQSQVIGHFTDGSIEMLINQYCRYSTQNVNFSWVLILARACPIAFDCKYFGSVQ